MWSCGNCSVLRVYFPHGLLALAQSDKWSVNLGWLCCHFKTQWRNLLSAQPCNPPLFFHHFWNYVHTKEKKTWHMVTSSGIWQQYFYFIHLFLNRKRCFNSVRFWVILHLSPRTLCFHGLRHTCSLSAHQHTSGSFPAISHSINPPAPHTGLTRLVVWTQMVQHRPAWVLCIFCITFDLKLFVFVAKWSFSHADSGPSTPSPSPASFPPAFPCTIKTAPPQLVSTTQNKRTSQRPCALNYIWVHIASVTVIQKPACMCPTDSPSCLVQMAENLN